MSNKPAVRESLAWFVSVTAGLLFFYEFMQLNMMNSLSEPLARDFNITAQEISWLSSWYFYANVIFLPLAGLLLDRYSTRKLILTAMTVCTLSILGFALSHSLVFSAFCRFVTGIGGAFCFLSCVRIASRWFAPKKMARITGVIVMMGMLGGLCAQAPLAFLIEKFGWRDALLIDTAMGAAFTILMWFVLRDRPAEHAHLIEHERKQIKAMGLWASIKLVIHNKHNWFAALYASFVNLPIFILGALWGTMYLTQVLHYSPTQAANVCGMLYIGTMIGAPILGWFSDRIQRRRLPMLLGALASIALIIPTLYNVHHSYNSLMLLFFLLGVATSSHTLSYSLVAESNPPLITGSAVSICSMMLLSGGALFQPISGWLLDRFWTPTFIDGVPQYALSDFHRGFMMMPVLFGVALVLALLVKESYCVNRFIKSELAGEDEEMPDFNLTPEEVTN